MYKINEIRPLEHPYLKSMECIADIPDIVYYLGKLPSERRPTVAIIGTRKPTAYGREVTRQLASDLARAGIVIVSGLALGVDACAHQAALDAGGTTIAVQANGLHKLNPPSNRQLGEAIIQRGGAIISELEEGIEPMPHRFLERNRLVSGMSDAVIVVEAAARSGTLNTAAHALVQGKELFAVPGHITSPMSAGCNQLLRQGATPVTCSDDILQVLFPSHQSIQAPLPIGSTPLENDIIACLRDGMRDSDAIIVKLKASPADFNTALTMLEINGVIKPLGANKWSL